MLEARKALPGLEHVIVIDGDAPEGTIALADVEGSNPDFDVAGAASGVEPDDVLTLIYTSGTTGPPKGVQLSHRRDHGLGEGDRGDHPAPGRRPAHLVAARRPHRRADGAPLCPDDLCRHDHDVPEPA